MAEKEIGDILEFIKDCLNKRKQGGETFSNFAKRNDLLEKNITNFMGYERTAKFHFKTTYKILRGILGRPPIPLKDKEDYLAIPLVEGRIAANPAGLIPGDAVESFIWLHRDQVGSRRDLVSVRLGPEAESMQPNLHPHDLVVIDRGDHEITAHGLYAVRLLDLESCTIKRIQPVPEKNYLLLLSDNPAYNPVPIEWHEHLIIGRVVWSCTNWVR